jgi:hypothetical protein
LLDFYIEKIYPPREFDSGIPDLSMRQYSPEYTVLDQARARLSQIIGDPEEQRQFLERFKALAGGKELNTKLTYEEYERALLPHCKSAGKFSRMADDGVVHNALQWYDIPALDMAKIDKVVKEQAAPSRAGASVIPIEKNFGVRPCPSCGKPVDARAIYCTQCSKTIAKHVACPNCNEPHVPDDLELCWKCALPMRQDEQIDCPQCFSWRGYEDAFPCPNCGYDPKAGPVMPIAETPAPDNVAPMPDPPRIFTAAAEPVQDVLVQCTTCYANVKQDARCAVCDNVLEART